MNYLPLYSYYHNLKIALPLYEFTLHYFLKQTF